MKNDAFTYGVEPGGLRNSADIKIFLCYLLGALPSALARTDLDQLVQEGGFANYFEVSQALTELLANGSVQEQESPEGAFLNVTEQGRRLAQTLETALPFSVRDKALKLAVKLLAKRRAQKENRVKIEKTENGIQVTCSVLDREQELMRISLLVADSMQAQTLKEQFLNNPSLIYQGVLALMTGDFRLLNPDAEPSSSG